MNYRVMHTTTYRYSKPVSLCHNIVHLMPRGTGRQIVRSSEVEMKPAPALVREQTDYFGNRATYFTIEEPHDLLIVKAVSAVEVAPRRPPPDAEATPPWETVRACAGTGPQSGRSGGAAVRLRLALRPGGHRPGPLRRCQLPLRPAAAGRRARPDAAHPRRVSLRPAGHHHQHAAARGDDPETRRLSGFRPFADRLSPLARFGRPLRQRLPADDAAARPGTADRRRRLARLAVSLVSRLSAGSTSTRPTLRSLRRATSCWPGAAITTTSVRSGA